MRAFARDIGISPSTLSRILRGKLIPGPAVWIRIAEQCEIPDGENLRILTMLIKMQMRRPLKRSERALSSRQEPSNQKWDIS
jgi:transcriptional regulator with XRE-family HTH domain